MKRRFYTVFIAAIAIFISGLGLKALVSDMREACAQADQQAYVSNSVHSSYYKSPFNTKPFTIRTKAYAGQDYMLSATPFVYTPVLFQQYEQRTIPVLVHFLTRTVIAKTLRGPPVQYS